MKKIVLITFLLLVLCLQIVSAGTYEVNIDPKSTESSRILVNESAKFTMTLTNAGRTSQVFTWNSDPTEWLVEGVTSVRVEANSTKQIDLLLKPRPSNYRAPGNYRVPLTVRISPSNIIINKQISVTIRPLSEWIEGYKPSVILESTIAKQIDPREKISVDVVLRNRNILDLSEIQILIDGELFDKILNYDLAGLEEKTQEYRFSVDPLTPPGTYTLQVLASLNGTTMSEVVKYYDVISYPLIERDKFTSSGFMKSTDVTTFTNIGNVKKSVTPTVDVPWYDLLFTNIVVEADSYETDGTNSWVIMLEPTEFATVTIYKNYQILFYLAIIVLVVVILYFIFRSPFVVTKEMQVTMKDNEGVSELKIRIFIRNRTGKTFQNVVIIDKVPTILEYFKPSGVGFLEPTKVSSSDKKGTILRWDVEESEGYDERVVMYRAKTRLKVVGDMNLPPVKVKFEDKKGKSYTTFSNNLILGNKE